ncbi:MAG: hypothetical protein ABIJ17_02350 [Patescibacteria group bacterium]
MRKNEVIQEFLLFFENWSKNNKKISKKKIKLFSEDLLILNKIQDQEYETAEKTVKKGFFVSNFSVVKACNKYFFIADKTK